MHRLARTLTVRLCGLVQIFVYLDIFTLEKYCTRTAQSSRVGCSRRVHIIVYLAVKKGECFGQYFTSENIMANYCHL